MQWLCDVRKAEKLRGLFWPLSAFIQTCLLCLPDHLKWCLTPLFGPLGNLRLLQLDCDAANMQKIGFKRFGGNKVLAIVES